MRENDPNTYRSEPCPCPPYWVATETYVAECGTGGTGSRVSVTRQARSTFSLEHARFVALDMAKREAESELQCTYTATQCVRPNCAPPHIYPLICREGTSNVSLAAAVENAISLAAADAAALCGGS